MERCWIRLVYFFLALLFGISTSVDAMLAGGRPNTFSGGNNAFAGVVNPANAVWIQDRFDVGTYLVHQKSSLNNCDNNPLFSPGKLDLTYKAKNLFSVDFAILKQFKLPLGQKRFESSLTLASYTIPSSVKIGTKNPVPLSGETPIFVSNKTEAISAIFSMKLNKAHSFGASVDFLRLSHVRDGFENSATPLKSVAPGDVTNRGTDHSHGVGCSVGWRWNITERLTFGAAYVKKTSCGQYKKYQGFEPHHAKNFIPQTLGGGFNYLFSKKVAGRLEALWSNLADLPGANNSILADGSLNLHKRGSNKSPGPGLQDALYINMGMGCQWNPMLAVGAGFSHRIKWERNSPYILSHSYAQQTIYDILSLGSIFKYKKHELFFIYSYGFKNRVSGYMPAALGGGRFESEKENMSFSLSWGYKY